MAERKVDLESLLSRAMEQEKEYDWLGAAGSYGEALAGTSAPTPAREGELLEETAHAISRWAFQATCNEEFLERIKESIGSYGRAIEAYEKASDAGSAAKAVRCRAMQSYLRSWKEKEVSKKKELVNAAWSATMDALAAFSQLKSPLDLALTYNRLHMNAVLAWNFEERPERRAGILDELVKCGKEAAEGLTEVSNPGELARVLVNLASSLEASSICIPMSSGDSDGLIEMSRHCLQRAMRFGTQATACEEIQANLLLGLDFSVGEPEDELLVEKWLDASKKTGDRLLQGIAHSYACSRMDWKGAGAEVPEDAERLLNIALGHAADTRRNFACLGFVGPDSLWLPWPSAPVTPWYYWRLARLETDLEKKHELARRALDESRQVLQFAKESGYPWAVWYGFYILGLTLGTAAELEEDYTRRRSMLEEAVEDLKVAIDSADSYSPGQLWDRGITGCICAERELELARMTKDREIKAAMVQSSAEHIREGVQLMAGFHTRVLGHESTDSSLHSGMGLYWALYGRALNMKSEVLGDRSILKSAAEAFEKASEESTRADRDCRAAESFWEAAKAYDALDEYSKSSKRFQSAYLHYTKAAQKIKSLSEYFEGYASYMKAWSEIEKAKYHHARQEPSKAKEHYQNASNLHSVSKKWGYLATNYLAWAEVENAEDMSQKEDSVGARQSFTKAIGLFGDSKKSLSACIDKIDSPDERDMVCRLIGATGMREEFCRARYELEEARLLDKQGRASEASDEYGQVAEMLQLIQKGSASELDKKEIGLILTLANAWKAMSRAEAEASPDLYEEAARLFEEAKDVSPGERAKNLTLGHSRFCKALGVGARFADSGDPALHDAAVSNLESATRFYVKAGFDKAAEYTRASKLLFDAYFHMGSAGKETDHDKKARTYALAERLLEASAVSYDKAGYSGKKEQVLRLLDRARQERTLAVSLTQVLRAPEETAATLAFSSPTPTHEMAVGLDKFEHADVQATLFARPKHLHVGQELALEIEFVNAGKGAAQLTKVEEVIPEGFGIVTEPEKCRVEDSCLNMKGRRLDSLRTEEVKLVLKPSANGRFRLRPRVMYLDGSGKYKSCEPEPIEVTVRELGISGWLKGPEKKR